MPRVTLQFHADGSELIRELLPRWLSGLDYFYAVSRRDGTIVDRRGASGPFVVDGDEGELAQVFIRLAPFVPTEGTDLNFLRDNGDFFVASVSYVVDGCLRESAIGSMSDDLVAMAAWRNVVRNAKRELLRGAVVIGVNGERRLDAQHRYSARAFDMWRDGVRMMAFAGLVTYDLDEGSRPGPADVPHTCA